MPDKPSPPADPRQLRRFLTELRGLVLLHRELGIESYPAAAGLQRLVKASAEQQPGPRASEKRPTGEKTVHPGRPANRSPGPERRTTPETDREPPNLALLAERLQDCQQCPHHQWRQKVIFGQGAATAKLLLVADFPGPAEESAGLPCQGEAGELLDRMLAAIQLKRQEVYLTTLVKCLPAPAAQYSAKTAKPDPASIRACLPVLQQQIAAIRPTLICTLGPLAAQTLLNTNKNLLQLRGRFHQYRQIPLMPTLAPDFLRHNPEMKKAAWQDLQIIQKFLQKNEQKQPAR
ncbi:uracil-DNA glycosylase [Desulfurivibrio dismutans]|uniref:uracil-DNA glycosylase n=1 Tax=Desulfurivibrio dismutans TaxID=1398908 RepID=UPI0023DCB87E|nr:uracil-DNA glycosylase [Desulfurivibrio alkaliphilus]MDF1614510.1 uracil-DNA glycosylase [Desulfurivibrio alkaliphilus]